MNAIVHQKDNGKLVYITNDADISIEDLYILLNKKVPQKYKGCNKGFNQVLDEAGLYNLNKLFERDLKKKARDIDEVYFISGGRNPNGSTVVRKYLGDNGGGIHCLQSEQKR